MEKKIIGRLIEEYNSSELSATEELSETEKEYDRETAMQTIKLIIKLGYNITKKHYNFKNFIQKVIK